MHVTDEVQQELERRDLLFEVSGGARKLRGKALNLVDHAVVGRAIRGRRAGRDCWMSETSLIEIGSADLNVDEVPLTGLEPRAVDVRIAVLVRPSRRAGNIVWGQ